MESIVRLTLKELDDICKFDIICFPDDYTERDTWIELLEDERTFVFAFKKDNVIKANISIYNWKGGKNYIKIMSIGTHPDYRNKGYAHMLMQYIIDEMLKDDMHIFKAETRESNIKMQKVFKDFGYIIINKEEEYYNNPNETAYKYSLEI
jgi:ribosomal-protein-alanine N-acetyltransferase